MTFRFVDGRLVETTDPDVRQVSWLGRDHTDLLAADLEGHDTSRRARGTGSHQTGTADDAVEPATPFALGSVVAFRRRKGSTGFGQVERVDGNGRVRIRSWLPCATVHVTLDPTDVRLVATPGQVYAWLTRGR